MRFERLTRGHVVAAVAALVLLLVMAMDWYGSHEADAARQAESGINVTGAGAGEAGRAVAQDARTIIARDEKNAWQERATIDRVLLVLLLASVFLPLVAAALRAAGRRSEPPWTPSSIAAITAALTALLVAYRIVNQPGDDTQTTIKVGVPLALVLLGIISLGAASAFQGEASWAQMRRAATAPAPEADAEAQPESDGETPATA